MLATLRRTVTDVFQYRMPYVAPGGMSWPAM
jgi:hypothetical protein